jgi:hypothetical protein
MSSGSDKTAPCIQAAGAWYIDNYNNTQEADDMCNKFSFETNKKTCLEAVKQNNFLFTQ